MKGMCESQAYLQAAQPRLHDPWNCLVHLQGHHDLGHDAQQRDLGTRTHTHQQGRKASEEQLGRTCAHTRDKGSRVDACEGERTHRDTDSSWSGRTTSSGTLRWRHTRETADTRTCNCEENRDKGGRTLFSGCTARLRRHLRAASVTPGTLRWHWSTARIVSTVHIKATWTINQTWHTRTHGHKSTSSHFPLTQHTQKTPPHILNL